MNDDYLINLLPSEYVPKPEFKGFVVFFIILVGLVGAYCWQDYIRLQKKLDFWDKEYARLKTEVDENYKEASLALDVQAKSRQMFAYAVSIWTLQYMNPPWIDVYNEIEESIPEGMWIESLKLVGGSEKRWPSFQMVGMVAGKEPETVLTFYEKMLDKESKFEKVKISGYTFVKHQGKNAITFNMTFQLKKLAFMGF